MVFVCHRLPFCHQPSSFPSWQSRSALAPRLASPIRVPQVPYSRVLGPRTPATRRKHQQTRNNAASIDMAIVMRIIGKFDRKILVAFHPSIMATERSNKKARRAWGALCAPKTPSTTPKIEHSAHLHVYKDVVTRGRDCYRVRGRINDRPGRCALDLQKASHRGYPGTGAAKTCEIASVD